jgi:YVTN family beta-propeller protein
MSEERLRSAAEALQRSVAEVDVMERLAQLEGRRRRYRVASAATAILLVAAVSGAVAVVARQARPDPVTVPTTIATAAAPAGTVVATIPVRAPSGVAVGGGAVWVTAGGYQDTRVLRIDPASNRVVASIPVPDGSDRLAVGAGAVWVANRSDNSVSRIDPAGNRVAATIGVGREPLGITVAAGSVWVASMLDDSVSRIDPAGNRVAATIPVPGQGSAVTVAAAGGAVWVSGNRGLHRIDPARNRVTATGVCCGDLAGGAGGLWVANGMDRTVLRVDPATGRVLAKIPAPPATAGEAPFGIAAAGAVWVTSATTDPQPGDPSLLWRVDPVGNRLVGTLRLGTVGPVGARHVQPTVAVDEDGTAWVTVGDRNAVLRIRPGP